MEVGRNGRCIRNFKYYFQNLFSSFRKWIFINDKLEWNKVATIFYNFYWYIERNIILQFSQPHWFLVFAYMVWVLHNEFLAFCRKKMELYCRFFIVKFFLKIYLNLAMQAPILICKYILHRCCKTKSLWTIYFKNSYSVQKPCWTIQS